jgi:two-component system chemotaxis sensor kinase CheA
MDPMAEIRATFFQECEEQLAELEAGLLAMEGGDDDSETVNAVFRAVHSVKGGAGAFGLDDLVRFAHVFETTMDEVRAGRLAPSPEVVKALLRAADVLADLVRAARDGGEVDAARCDVVAAELSAASGVSADDHGDGGDDDMDIDFTPMAAPVAMMGGDVSDLPPLPDIAALMAGAGGDAAAEGWSIYYKPRAELYAKANETAVLLRELGRLGKLTTELDTSALPPFGQMDPEGSYFAWNMTLTGSATEAQIREVFEFVESECELVITQAGAAAPEAPTLDLPLPPPVVEEAAPANFDLSALISSAQAEVAAAGPPPKVAEDVPVEEVAAVLNAPPANTNANRLADAGKAAVQPTIRVDLDRVDRLIDLVGELVINQAMMAQRVTEAGLARASSVAGALDELEQLTREIQDSVMAIRAQPVKSVFQRMPRLVREVASAVGKQARLVTEGEGTEVDKTVIERLTDPLTHMIRNAIDHGLETPEKRLAAGKPAEGVVRLAALHRSGRIVIEVSDDGGGINRERVKKIAIDKGLIPPDASLTDDETDNLIFLPGFSTADTISDISGRGVGMDVVRRSIQELGGRISIASRPGEGSTFTMSLPLTLAVLDGMVLSCCEQTLVAPLSAIIETLQPKQNEVRSLGGTARVISIRGQYVPLVDVGMVLGYRTEALQPDQGVALLTEGEGGSRAVLLVDAIQGQRQVVIKSLEANYRRIRGIAAATILGDGRVALILDIDALVAATRMAAAAGAESSRMLQAG